MERLPAWFKQAIPTKTTVNTARIISGSGIHTVCQEASCPNINTCYANKTATFLILGDTCTRNCRFCAVSKLENNQILKLDSDEPRRTAEAVKGLGLDYVVITSVTRDDLDDGGAEIFATTIESIRMISKKIKIEVLIPDFDGKISSLKTVLGARPDCVGHNIETVKRLYMEIRPGADFERSLKMLRGIKEIEPLMVSKSSIMLGMGETGHEVEETMRELRLSDCDILTLGQYLAPSAAHFPVKEFISPERFDMYSKIGYGLGFKAVLSGPLVRSSYQAEKAFCEANLCTI